MHPLYARVWTELNVAEKLEKYASAAETDTSTNAQIKLAALSSALVESLLTKADGTTKEAKAAGVVDILLSLREDHAENTKMAASPDQLADLSIKLATCLYLDGVLTDTVDASAGPTKEAALKCRTLGREYAVTLMQGLLK